MPLPLALIPAGVAAAGGLGYWGVRRIRMAAVTPDANPYVATESASGPKGMSPALKKAFDDAIAAPINSMVQSEWLELSDLFAKQGYETEGRQLYNKAQAAPTVKPMSKALKETYDKLMAAPVNSLFKKDWEKYSQQFNDLGYGKESADIGMKAQSASNYPALPPNLQKVFDWAMVNGKGYYFMIRLSQLFSDLQYADQSKDLGMKAHLTWGNSIDKAPYRILLASDQKIIDNIKARKYELTQYEKTAKDHENKQYLSVASIIRLAILDPSITIPLPPNTTDSDIVLKV